MPPVPRQPKSSQIKEEKYPTIPEPYFRDTCFTCSITSALATEFVISRIDSQKTIYCPNGHRGIISKKYVEEVLNKTKIPWDQFSKLSCSSCGCHFQLENLMFDCLKKSGKQFYCPNGCGIKITSTPIPKTEADIDYEKLIAYHDALGRIAQLEPETFKNKRRLKMAISIAKLALDLQKYHDQSKE